MALNQNLLRKGAYIEPGEDVAYHAGVNPIKNKFASYTNAIQDRHNQFVEEAKRLGMTDPMQIDKYAMQKNADWGQAHSINAGEGWLGRHPWMAPLGVLGAGLGGLALGGLGAAGAAEGGSLAGVNAADEAFAGVGGGGAGGSIGAGGLEGGGNALASGQGSTIVGNTSAAAGTPLSRILDGSATTADFLSLGGNLGGSLLGILGSRNASKGFGDLSDKYLAMGAPSRARYEASMAPGFDPTSIPGYSGAVDTASRGILARLAASGGNPYGNPGGLIEANKQIISGTALPAIDAYQRLNAGTGGYAGFNAAAPGAATAQIGAQGGIYNAIGSGLAGLLNPQSSVLDTLRGLGIGGLT